MMHITSHVFHSWWGNSSAVKFLVGQIDRGVTPPPRNSIQNPQYSIADSRRQAASPQTVQTVSPNCMTISDSIPISPKGMAHYTLDYRLSVAPIARTHQMVQSAFLSDIPNPQTAWALIVSRNIFRVVVSMSGLQL
jgi:hypothetical protein